MKIVFVLYSIIKWTNIT